MFTVGLLFFCPDAGKKYALVQIRDRGVREIAAVLTRVRCFLWVQQLAGSRTWAHRLCRSWGLRMARDRTVTRAGEDRVRTAVGMSTAPPDVECSRSELCASRDVPMKRTPVFLIGEGYNRISLSAYVFCSIPVGTFQEKHPVGQVEQQGRQR